MPFTFGGVTTNTPQVLVRSEIGQQVALQLLPNGVICFVGSADGGEGDGTVYRVNDTRSAQTILRAGPLLDAVLAAAQLGASAGFVLCVANPKTQATLNLAGNNGAEATFTSGDYGSWTNGITVSITEGTNTGTFCATFTYTDFSGTLVTIGGVKTPFDNLADFTALASVIVKNTILTPPAATGLPPIITMAITTNGVPTNTVGATPLAGGSGSGTDELTLPQVTEAIDELVDVPFDIGHLVKCYDPEMWAYASMQGAEQIAIYGNLRRWFHQFQVNGASPSQSKKLNSEALANAGVGYATALNSKRSQVVGQQVNVYDPASGSQGFMDAAPLLCGVASYVGATDVWGPASPLTKVPIATALDIDYACLSSTGDVDRAIAAGVWLLERTTRVPTLGGVGTIRSVTTAPNDPATGLPWPYGEFSIVRVSDAVLANVKGAITNEQPRALGGGNTPKNMAAVVSEVVNVLELAKDNQWIVSYDKSSINISTTGGQGDADLLNYSLVPTPPLNFIGITQTLLPFAATLTASGTINS